jgi:hypothetical protein
MAGKIKIRSNFSDGLESKLLKKVCLRRQSRNVYVTNFPRFGFSGAQLLLLYFKKKPRGLPFLLKIGQLKKVEDEHAATKFLESDLEDANFAEDCVFRATDSNGSWGALLYRFRGTRTFRELMYDSGISTGTLRSMVKEVFQRLKSVHEDPILRRVVLKSHFKRYFRKHKARGRIRPVLGRSAKSVRPEFLGARIYNPLRFLSSLPRYATLNLTLVHGDLHPDNIVIDRNGVPHLIDFAWAHSNRDVLIDYVLLENSIRFMAFPAAGAINLEDQLSVDRLLLEENGFKRINSIEFSGPARREDYARLAAIVGVIRKRGRHLMGDQFSMRSYLLTQFIVLYGLLRYDNYEPYAATRALGLIAARLNKIGLPSP